MVRKCSCIKNLIIQVSIKVFFIILSAAQIFAFCWIIFQVFVLKITIKIFKFNSVCIIPCLHLILWVPSGRLLIKFDNKQAMNFASSINYNLLHLVFLISFPFLSTLVNLFYYWNWTGFLKFYFFFLNN